MSSSERGKIGRTWDLLLGIVSRINKYSRIESSPNSIRAHDNYAVFISIDKVITEQDPPLSVEEFVFAISAQVIGRASAVVMRSNEVAEFFGELNIAGQAGFEEV